MNNFTIEKNAQISCFPNNYLPCKHCHSITAIHHPKTEAYAKAGYDNSFTEYVCICPILIIGDSEGQDSLCGECIVERIAALT